MMFAARGAAEGAERLGAEFFSLWGSENATKRLFTASRFVRRAQKAQDEALFLVARAWQILPLLELREIPVLDVELEAIGELAAQAQQPLYLGVTDILTTLRASSSASAALPPNEATRQAIGRLAAAAQAGANRDPLWPSALGLLSELCAGFWQGDAAEPTYRLLLECTRRETDAVDLDGDGGTARALGLLAATASRWEDAERHFDEALDASARAHDAAIQPLTQHGYAALLLGSFRTMAGERADKLLAEAVAGYERLGLQSELERALALRAKVRGAELPAAEKHAPSLMIKEGDYWTLEYAGKLIRLKDSKGLGDIFYLLQRPGEELHVMELVAAVEGTPQGSHPCGSKPAAQTLEEDHLTVSGLQARREAPDRQAMREYAQRLGGLRGELEEATRNNDLGQIDRTQRAIEAIEHEVASAYGLGRQAREAGDPMEKARKAVSKRIWSEIRRIAPVHASLARHLSSTIKTGIFCSYSPSEPTVWKLEPGPALESGAPLRPE